MKNLQRKNIEAPDTNTPKTILEHISTVKAGEKLLYNGCVYTATCDACADNEGDYYVDVESSEGPEKCLYDTDFGNGVVEVILASVKKYGSVNKAV